MESDSKDFVGEFLLSRVDNGDARIASDSENSASCAIAQFEVESLLRGESSRASIEAPDYKRKRSECWKKFGFPKIDGVLHTNIVACVVCKTVYKYSSSKGTSHLNKHVCHNNRDQKPRSAQKIEQRLPIRKTPRPSVGDMLTLESEVLDACALDGVPTKGYISDGIRLLLRAAARYGAKHGGEPDMDALTDSCERGTHGSLLRRHLAIQEDILRALANEPFCAASDIWIESSSGKLYKSVTIHQISPDWEMRSYIWMTSELDLGVAVDRTPGTALPNAPFRLIAVDDSNSATGLFQDRELENCVERIHNLSSCVTSLCFESDDVGKVKSTMKSTALLYEHADLHYPHFHQKLAATDDSSNIHMAKFVLDNWADLQTALEGQTEMSHMDSIDKTMLTQIVKIFKPLYDCAAELETDARPTMHRVRYWEAKLGHAFGKSKFDSPDISKMKEIGRSALQTHLVDKLGIYYDIATVLDPRVGELDDRSKMIQVYGKVEYIHERIAGKVRNSLGIENTDPVDHPPKRIKREGTGSGSDTEDVEVDFYKEKRPLSSVTEELQMFTRSSFNARQYTDDETARFNIIDFWKDHAPSYPKLAEVARLVLACPSSGAPAKQNFTQGGWVVNVRRAKFHPDEMDPMLCIRSYLKRGAWEALAMDYNGSEGIQQRTYQPALQLPV